MDILSMATKIRVENMDNVLVSQYSNVQHDSINKANIRPFTILFIKPYQSARENAYGPPLGILTLISGIRAYFGSIATVHFWDMKLYHHDPQMLSEKIAEYNPDIIAISALNCEAGVSYQLAQIAKTYNNNIITALGGPFTLRQAALIFEESIFDWVFEGAADRTFLQALERHFSNTSLEDDIAGFSYRTNKKITFNNKQDLITDLDAIPMPAWDLIDFERYRKRDRNRIIANVNERKYAFVFTSRGCPYLCNYCHDVFTKRFIYRSEENVLEEIRILYEDYGVTEIHIIDDIFNLHRPRAQSIMRAIAKRWPNKLYIAFPNGLRGDILDIETIEAMVAAGTYHATISIETVTPRLQNMVEKYLDIEKAKWSIEEFAKRGVIVQGAFMLGFPTETPQEIEDTLNYAIHSSLTHAHFFAVVPQPQTPIYEQALQEAPQVTAEFAKQEREIDYNGVMSWYARAYDYDLQKKLTYGFIRFTLHPKRVIRLLKHYPMINLVQGVLALQGRIIITMTNAIKSFFSPKKKFKIKPS